jgi:hypothetical protein
VTVSATVDTYCSFLPCIAIANNSVILEVTQVQRSEAILFYKAEMEKEALARTGLLLQKEKKRKKKRTPILIFIKRKNCCKRRIIN